MTPACPFCDATGDDVELREGFDFVTRHNCQASGPPELELSHSSVYLVLGDL